MARYGRPDCKHDWVYRVDGYVEQCVPAICRECGAFGCMCDMGENRKPWEEFKAQELAGDINVNGRWVNPYVKAKPAVPGKCARCGLVWDDSVGYCGACGGTKKQEAVKC